jgi:hypothetical protein
MFHAPITDILTGVFSGSVVLLLLSALVDMYINYNYTDFLIVTCVAGSIALGGAAFAAIVAGRNRFIMWVRFSSPEGKAIVEKSKRLDGAQLDALRQQLAFQIADLKELKELLELQDVKERMIESKSRGF